MLQLSPEWFSLGINLAISLIVTFLVDFLVVRYLILSTNQTHADSVDEKLKREIYWSFGILPGILIFVFLSMSTLLEMSESGARAIFILAFAIFIIIASFSGGKVASLTTKQIIEADFDLESE